MAAVLNQEGLVQELVAMEEVVFWGSPGACAPEQEYQRKLSHWVEVTVDQRPGLLGLTLTLMMEILTLTASEIPIIIIVCSN